MRDFEAINENLRCALAGFSWVTAAGETETRDGMSLAYSGSPFGLFNTAVLTAMPRAGEFPRQLEAAAGYFRERRAPWSVWLCDTFFPPEERGAVRIRMGAWGLKPAMEAPGMIATGLADPVHLLPRLDYLRVEGYRARRDFSRIMSVAFRISPQMADQVYASERLWVGPLRGYVGYLRGVPVTTAVVVIGGGVIGIYAVATDPRFQRQGFGEAIVREVISLASNETGLQTVVLQSSILGYRIYCRMGFRQVTRFGVFATDESQD